MRRGITDGFPQPRAEFSHAARRCLDVAGLSHQQHNVAVLLPDLSADMAADFFVTYQTTEGRLLVYAAVVDNISGDGVARIPEPLQSPTGAATGDGPPLGPPAGSRPATAGSRFVRSLLETDHLPMPDAYLEKPVDGEELALTVAQALR